MGRPISSEDSFELSFIVTESLYFQYTRLINNKAFMASKFLFADFPMKEIVDKISFEVRMKHLFEEIDIDLFVTRTREILVEYQWFDPSPIKHAVKAAVVGSQLRNQCFFDSEVFPEGSNEARILRKLSSRYNRPRGLPLNFDSKWRYFECHEIYRMIVSGKVEFKNICGDTLNVVTHEN
jgi:hypothetical protein